jgi:hypothetical protein
MFLVDMRISFASPSANIAEYRLVAKGLDQPNSTDGSRLSVNWPVKSAKFRVRYRLPAKIEPIKPAADNLRIVRILLFGTRSFRQINSKRQSGPLW